MVKERGHVCQKMRKAAFGPSSISLLPQTQFSGSLLAPHQIISCSFPTLSMPPMDPSDHRPIVFHPISPLYPRPNLGDITCLKHRPHLPKEQVCGPGTLSTLCTRKIIMVTSSSAADHLLLPLNSPTHPYLLWIPQIIAPGPPP